MNKINRYEWERMTNQEVIDYWESHEYADTYRCEHTVSGFGFSSAAALDNYSNCKQQMKERGLI